MRAGLCGTTNRSVVLSVRMVRTDAGFRTVGHVRFGSKADMCAAKRHVCFTPNSDRESENSAKGHVWRCYAPKPLRHSNSPHLAKEGGRTRPGNDYALAA